jgi:hypothetical protein
LITLLSVSTTPAGAEDAGPASRYFAHPAVEDRYGVIAPWYRGQNGQCDFRLRIAAETLKRYPRTDPGEAVMPGPHYIFNGTWTIDPHGFIQSDPSAFAGSGILAAYQVTGNPRYKEAAQHWSDLLAQRCNPQLGVSPWPRYVNPESLGGVNRAPGCIRSPTIVAARCSSIR